YDKSGHTNAAWDGDAHRAIDLFFPLGPDPLHGPAEPRDAALAAFQAAVDKGCRDPLLLALRGITDGQDAGRSYHTPTGNMTRIIDDLQKENYPAAVKMRVVNGYLRTTNITAGDRALIPISLVTEVAKTSGLPAGELDALANEFYMAQHENHDQFQVLNPFVDAYQRAAPNSAGPRLLRARAKLDAAFTTINNIDHFVNPPLWKQVLPQLKEVEALLQEAWRLDPRDPHAPSLMVGVKMYESEDGGGEEAMELWFHRAMESDPDSYEACVAKLAYLSPAWHGSAGQMLGFGRECLATENWRAGLPLILVQAHNRLSEGAPDSRQYFERPEVWADIREVFTGAVLNFPNDVNLRCEYAKYAAKCGQWDAAHRQFEIIGDKPVLAVFGSQASYDYLRKKAKHLAAQAPATGPATN
ncbi:MAG: hypothetical protein JWN51_1150, partial [Phycisphaerales bacterium]|nr:hypothetical protein [Phycisphaerales bacterium]